MFYEMIAARAVDGLGVQEWVEGLLVFSGIAQVGLWALTGLVYLAVSFVTRGRVEYDGLFWDVASFLTRVPKSEMDNAWDGAFMPVTGIFLLPSFTGVFLICDLNPVFGMAVIGGVGTLWLARAVCDMGEKFKQLEEKGE